MLRADSSVPLNVLKHALDQPADHIVDVAAGWFDKGGGNRMFYLPTRDEPATPETWGYAYEEVEFNSKDGTRLYGWVIAPKAGKAKGTIVFSHGNADSMAYHLGFSTWLAKAGYQVLMYDYRGFGKSGGQVDRKGMIEDVSAAFSYAKSREDSKGLGLISYGHSLGGAKSITALATNPVAGLKAVIVEGTIASYQAIAEHLGGRVGSSLVTDEWSPQDYIAKIAPVPVLVIHGTKDRVVPVGQGKRLFECAAEPKLLYEVENGRHGDSLVRNKGEYRKRMLAWMAEL